MAAKKYVCKVCGYVHEGNEAPSACPLCKAGASEFEAVKDKKKGFNTNSDTYAIIYSAVVVVIVAFLLAGVSSALKPFQDANVELDKKKQILASLNLNVKELSNPAETYKSLIEADLIVDIQGNVIVDSCGFKFPDDTTVVNKVVANLRKEKGETPFVVLDANKKVVAETGTPEIAKDTVELLTLYRAQKNDSTMYIIPMTGNGLWGGIWGYLALNDDCNTIYGVYFSHASETPGLGAEIAGDKFQKLFPGKKVYDKDGRVALTVAKGGAKASEESGVDAISGATITCNGVDGMLKSKLAPYYKYLNAQCNSIPAIELVPSMPVATDTNVEPAATDAAN